MTLPVRNETERILPSRLTPLNLDRLFLNA
jgi:hypothetical protein